VAIPAVIASRGSSKCIGLPSKQDLAAGRLVHARHGLDEGGLAGTVVAEQAMAFAGIDSTETPASAITEPKCFSMFFISIMGACSGSSHLSPVIMRRM
jgi:hypothetical protein